MTRPLKAVSAFITKGATPTTYGFQWEQSGVPFLRSECVSTHGLDMKQAMYISSKADAALQRSRVREGDILMTITGYVGRVIRLTGLPAANINQHIARIRINDDSFESRFVYHYLSQPWIKANYETITTGQAYPQISLTQVRDTEIPALPLYEQKAIANALDTADDLIVTLERLIAKKRAIKQGMMQELLTGRTRLPGFSGEWLTDTLGSVSRIKTGSRNNQDKDSSGPYPFFVRSATVERIGTYSYNTEAILVPGEGGIGSIFHYINGKFEVHQRVYIISDFSPVVAGKFIYYYMRQFFGPHAMENSVKATVDSLRLPTFTSFELKLPPSRAEQTAIVEVLENSDADIEALERRLESTRAIKQGMMQELLTGRTRLPVAEEGSA
ncbi:MAG: restriction endonuclease subunit S [Pseudoclavibacter sp.]